MHELPNPSREVLEWLDRQAPATLYVTTINIVELWAGIEVLPAGKRRTQLQHSMATEVMPLFKGRVLAFDEDCAKAQAAGNTVDFADCAIAAIAVTHRFMLATRNSRDFKATGIELLNPWMSAA